MKENRLKKILSGRGVGQVVTVTIGLLVICAVFALINPNFLKGPNIAILLRQIAPILIIGIGQSYVLITGNIDLSIGSVIGMSCMISATLMVNGMHWLPTIFITIFLCLIIGAINGILVGQFKLPPFIATLGTMTISRGIAQIVNGNYNTDSIGMHNQPYRDFFYYGRPFLVYNTVWIAIALFLIFNFLLSRTKTGRHIYAIGSNVNSARLSGVNVPLVTTKVYLVSAFCASVVGLITSATSGMGSMDAGTGYEMYAVAASVIGGVSTLGGTGILIGTVVGASIWAVLQNGLQFANAPVAIRNIVIGIIVVVSVLLDVVLRSGRKTRARKTVANSDVKAETT